jgi:hypothetical protein
VTVYHAKVKWRSRSRTDIGGCRYVGILSRVILGVGSLVRSPSSVVDPSGSGLGRFSRSGKSRTWGSMMPNLRGDTVEVESPV